MIKATYKMHTYQKWAFGETSNTCERTFIGEDEFDIYEQLNEVAEVWYQDPAVKSVRFEKVSEEPLEVGG